MTDSPDVLDPDATATADADIPESRRRTARRNWREGGTSVRAWGWEMVGWCVLGIGAGLIGGSIVAALVGGEAGVILSLVVLWLGFAAPVVVALLRSRPRGLFAFRPVDLLFGVVLGLALRTVSGWLDLAAGGGAWPTYFSLDGALPGSLLFTEVIGGIFVAPFLEELLFRAVLLVAVYTAVRRLAGAVPAAVASVLVSTGLFVLVHALAAPLTWDATLSIGLVGLVTSLVVLATGRVWTAIVTHFVFNASLVLLTLVGTFAA